eukprot:Nk52_evm36s234 gene=Nk52_evmTU36s234
MNDLEIPGYKSIGVLGRGSFSLVVVKAVAQDEGNERKHFGEVAIKVIDRKTLAGSLKEKLLTEIEITKALKHPNVVEFIDVLYNSRCVFIVLEFCNGGDMGQFMKTHKEMPEVQAKYFFRQLVNALIFMHHKKLSHLDLKPRNLLLVRRSFGQPLLKVADFGLSCYTQELSSLDNVEKRGSLLYMAPEILLDSHYCPEADIWSCGIILFEMLFNRTPFSGPSVELICNRIVDTNVNVYVKCSNGKGILSLECVEILRSMLEKDPSKRLSFANLHTHEFVDMTHLPSKDCLPKGKALVEKALKFDRNGEFSSALEFYKDGIEFLVSSLEYEPLKETRDGIRNAMAGYMKRAEDIKRELHILMKNKEEFWNEAGTLSSVELLPSSSRGPLLKAVQKDRNCEYVNALELYLKALEFALKDMQEIEKVPLKTRLVKKIMQRAELIKAFLKALEGH